MDDDEMDMDFDRNADYETEKSICNPDISEDIEISKIKGDAIGNTLYSERWVLKTLITLAEYTDVDWCNSFEQQLCLLWDMTAEQDVVLFLLENEFLGIFYKVVKITKVGRLTEILVGIIGNMCCFERVKIEIAQSEPYCMLLINLLTVDDSLTLVQLIRLFNTCFWKLRKPDHLVEYTRQNSPADCVDVLDENVYLDNIHNRLWTECSLKQKEPTNAEELTTVIADTSTFLRGESTTSQELSESTGEEVVSEQNQECGVSDAPCYDTECRESEGSMDSQLVVDSNVNEQLKENTEVQATVSSEILWLKYITLNKDLFLRQTTFFLNSSTNEDLLCSSVELLETLYEIPGLGVPEIVAANESYVACLTECLRQLLQNVRAGDTVTGNRKLYRAANSWKNILGNVATFHQGRIHLVGQSNRLVKCLTKLIEIFTTQEALKTQDPIIALECLYILETLPPSKIYGPCISRLLSVLHHLAREQNVDDSLETESQDEYEKFELSEFILRLENYVRQILKYSEDIERLEVLRLNEHILDYLYDIASKDQELFQKVYSAVLRLRTNGLVQ